LHQVTAESRVKSSESRVRNTSKLQKVLLSAEIVHQILVKL